MKLLEKIKHVFRRSHRREPLELEISESEAAALPEGLTADQVRERTARGQVNLTKGKHGKSYLRIVTDNLFTYFNLIWAIVTALLVLVGSLDNLTFLVVVVPNLVIAIVQEARAKAIVEKLSVTTDPRAVVVRDGNTYVEGENTIAGSTTPLFKCVRRAIEFGIKEEDAVKMATENPARLMNLNKGKIEVGYDAEFIIVDDEFNLKSVIVRGEIAYKY